MNRQEGNRAAPSSGAIVAAGTGDSRSNRTDAARRR